MYKNCFAFSKACLRCVVFSLLLLTVLSAGSCRLGAQCQAAGPSLEQTQNYIVAHSRNTTSMFVDPDRGRWIEFTGQDAHFKSRYVINYMSLDCRQTSAGVVNGEPWIAARIKCKSGLLCVHYQLTGNQTGDNEDEYWRDGASGGSQELKFMVQSDDQQLLQNLANALMHYIFLLQQDFRQRHTDVSDPFQHPQ